MSDTDQVTVTENASVVRDPVTGEAHQVIERTVTERKESNWALWVAGIAVFVAALVLALGLLGRNDPAAADLAAAQAEAEAARLQAEQAALDASQARMDAAVSGLTVGNSANSAAAISAAAQAEAAAARASAAADSARSAPPVVVHSPAPAASDSDGGSEDLPPSQ